MAEKNDAETNNAETNDVRVVDKPLRRVFVRDLELMASVGIYEVEHRYEQRIVVSIDVEVVDTYDGSSERISDVFDYSVMVRETEALCQSRHFKLIETLADVIAGHCLADARVRTATVRIEKPDIMPGCRSVGIEIRRVAKSA
jgi:7,8-dihydroneopterin aldolase/epimerase/oxygenase